MPIRGIMTDYGILRDYTEGLERLLAQQARIIMFIIEGERSIVWTNNAFREMFGRQLPTGGLDIRELLTSEGGKLLDAAGGMITDGMKLVFSCDKKSAHMLVCRVLSSEKHKLVFSEEVMATEAVVMKSMTRMNNELSNLTRDLHRKNVALQQAMEEIKVLKGLLPICSYCKKIRDDKGYWDNLETYIGKHSKVEFSHGICDDCMGMHFPDIPLEKKKKGK